MGGDPVLNTFARGSPIELARLMFHELAHQVVYVSGDMAFSEGYATAVEQLGLAHWAQHPASASVTAPAWAAWQRRQAQRRDLMALIQAHKAELAALYRSRMADGARLERKRALQARLQQQYEQLRDGAWQGDRAFDPWVLNLNNASLALQGSYQDLVPAFTALFEREGRDFARWHAAVKALAARPAAERRAALRELCATCMNDGVQPRPSP
jgi:predicted aminopeptidase